jgi:hypothetical protein
VANDPPVCHIFINSAPIAATTVLCPTATAWTKMMSKMQPATEKCHADAWLLTLSRVHFREFNHLPADFPSNSAPDAASDS